MIHYGGEWSLAICARFLIRSFSVLIFSREPFAAVACLSWQVARAAKNCLWRTFPHSYRACGAGMSTGQSGKNLQIFQGKNLSTNAPNNWWDSAE